MCGFDRKMIMAGEGTRAERVCGSLYDQVLREGSAEKKGKACGHLHIRTPKFQNLLKYSLREIKLRIMRRTCTHTRRWSYSLF